MPKDVLHIAHGTGNAPANQTHGKIVIGLRVKILEAKRLTHVFISKLVCLHFKQSYSVCAHERLEATVCIGLSARAATSDIFHVFT